MKMRGLRYSALLCGLYDDSMEYHLTLNITTVERDILLMRSIADQYIRIFKQVFINCFQIGQIDAAGAQQIMNTSNSKLSKICLNSATQIRYFRSTCVSIYCQSYSSFDEDAFQEFVRQSWKNVTSLKISGNDLSSAHLQRLSVVNEAMSSFQHLLSQSLQQFTMLWLNACICLSMIISCFALNQIVISSSNCRSDEFLTLNFTFDNRAPPPQHMTVDISIFKIEQICSMKRRNSKELMPYIDGKAWLVIGGAECDYLQKIKWLNSSASLFIIIEKDENRTITTFKNTSVQSHIPIIFLSRRDGEALAYKMNNCLNMTAELEIEVVTHSADTISLPDVYFNIESKKGFSYFRQMYLHYLFDRIQLQLSLNHLILFTDKNCKHPACVEQLDCLNDLNDNSTEQYCFVSGLHSSGRKIMLQQIRSKTILELLGTKIWWQYVVLFSDNLCDESKRIDKCAESTLIELNIQKADIENIQKRAVEALKFETLQQMDRNGLVKIIKRRTKALNAAVYSSRVHQTYLQLCQNIKNISTSVCQQIKHTPFDVNIKDFSPYSRNFYEPNFRNGTYATQIIHLELEPSVYKEMTEILIIFTIMTKQNFQNFTYYKQDRYDDGFESKLKLNFIAGVFGRRDSILEEDIQFTSKPYEENNHILILKKKEIIAKKLTLILTFTGHQAYIFRIMANNNIPELHTDSQRIDFINSEKNATFELVFDNFRSEELSRFDIISEGESRNVNMYISSTSDFSQFNQHNIRAYASYFQMKGYSGDQATYAIYRTSLIALSQKTLLTNCRGQGSNQSCSIFVRYQKIKETSVNQMLGQQKSIMIKVKMIKFEKTAMIPYLAYNTIIDFESIFGQYLTIGYFGQFIYRLPFEMVLKTSVREDFVIQMRTCKNFDNKCKLEAKSNWADIYKQETVLMQSQNLNLPETASQTLKFERKLNFRAPSLQKARFLKRENLTIYIIYIARQYASKINQPKRQYSKSQYRSLVQSISFSSYYSDFYLKTLSRNSMLTYGYSQRFKISEYVYGKNTYCTIYLILNNVEDNIRVFADIYFANCSQKISLHKFNESFYGKSQLTNPNYFEETIIFKYEGSMKIEAIYIDVFVQDASQQNNQTPTDYYSIGMSSDSNLRTKKYLLGENSQITTFSQSYIANRTQHYAVYPASKIVVISFELYDFAQNTFFLCTYVQNEAYPTLNQSETCFNQDDVRYWKNLRGEDLIRGLKFVNKSLILFNVYHQKDQNLVEYNLEIKAFDNLVAIDADHELVISKFGERTKKNVNNQSVNQNQTNEKEDVKDTKNESGNISSQTNSSIIAEQEKQANITQFISNQTINENANDSTKNQSNVYKDSEQLKEPQKVSQNKTIQSNKSTSYNYTDIEQKQSIKSPSQGANTTTDAKTNTSKEESSDKTGINNTTENITTDSTTNNSKEESSNETDLNSISAINNTNIQKNSSINSNQSQVLPNKNEQISESTQQSSNISAVSKQDKITNPDIEIIANSSVKVNQSTNQTDANGSKDHQSSREDKFKKIESIDKHQEQKIIIQDLFIDLSANETQAKKQIEETASFWQTLTNTQKIIAILFVIVIITMLSIIFILLNMYRNLKKLVVIKPNQLVEEISEQKMAAHPSF